MANETLTVTADMTVQTLIDAGVFTSLAQVQGFADRAAQGARGTANPDRQAFAQEVFEIMLEQPTAAWKNGKILKTWFPNGKEADAELEKQRVKRHAAISRALADLVDEGRLVKDRSGDSASTTFYKIVESHIPTPETDSSDEGEGVDDETPLEMLEEAERIEFEDAQDEADYVADLES